MALVGLSIILASLVYFAVRRPPLIETLVALWRGNPQIDQPPRTGSPDRSPPSPSDANAIAQVDGENSLETPSINLGDQHVASTKANLDRAAMPPPPILVKPLAPPRISQNEEEPSPQTTPKASAVLSNGSVPSFTLNDPPASSARPSTRDLNSRPPPTHSSKPAKPGRQVVLKPGHSPLDWARIANSPTSDLRNLPPGTPYLKVTPSMLKRQTGRKGKDAWTVLGGRVYNITPYAPFHPGGEPELLRAAGRDGTKLFGEIHPWVNYEGMLASSLVGMMVEEHEAVGDGDMDAMD
ncbi:uncharacterized protein BCR38DRAFT_489910 [Pseudomassariella vexata]|uniref:Cytochrome b5 heme-binding domain-containing protein n=1 Tax=Pseudomassariella vexata TaxID=1141098 RepID=A0A1Y2DGT3_9PEZI|nr:uncharacterized protein BCR38DRAFT_489910 [Pseudomassariella vexata]ORY57915.1 hypothetical protein BCR38DRAFT_489910 [Pseudomassariella vexata]